MSIDVVANDTDIDSTTLIIATVNTPGHGSAVAGASGTMTYTPAENYSGADEFTYTITDGTTEATGTVTITVSCRRLPVRPGMCSASIRTRPAVSR